MRQPRHRRTKNRSHLNIQRDHLGMNTLAHEHIQYENETLFETEQDDAVIHSPRRLSCSSIDSGVQTPIEDEHIHEENRKQCQRLYRCAIASVIVVGMVVVLGAVIRTFMSGNSGGRMVQFSSQSVARTVSYTYTLKAEYPHDTSAFTQGLTFVNGTMYEGTGLFGQSELRIVDHVSGSVHAQTKLESKYFGEGICVFGDTIYQLTWRTGVGFLYDAKNLTKKGRFNYKTIRRNEGWGITHDGTHLYVSDGSQYIYVWDPHTLKEIRRFPVYNMDGKPLRNLNELEYVNGELLANIWFRDEIARIDPERGTLYGFIDFSNLVPSETRGNHNAVLNGIAVDTSTIPPKNSQRAPLDGVTLFITGKLWPKLFQVELHAALNT